MRGRRYHLAGPAPQSRLLRELLADWRRSPGDDWSLWWSAEMPPRRAFRRLVPGRWVNHLPGIEAIARKDALAWTLTLARLEGLLPRRAIHPRTWVLPDERSEFLEAAARSPRGLWIRKPARGSNGRGIRLFQQPELAARGRACVVQRYLDRPHLLDGHKYSLRLYVAIVDWQRVWLHDDGFAKLATHPFARENWRDPLAHLTNPEVQARNRDVPVSGRNLVLADYRARLAGDGIDVPALWGQIGALASMVARAGRLFGAPAMEERLPRSRGRAFELLGLDVVLDRERRPWLIECNLSPSLSVEAAAASRPARQERAVKRRVVGDLLALVGLLPPRRNSGFRELAID